MVYRNYQESSSGIENKVGGAGRCWLFSLAQQSQRPFLLVHDEYIETVSLNQRHTSVET